MTTPTTSTTPTTLTAQDADQTRAIGRALAAHLRAGDLVMLRGQLGAGKTTFAQGIGEGLHVRGHVASPTYIVARVHPSLVGGPALIHADAYRITDLDDLETLDLDSTLDSSVTVVEWGEGKTEALSDQRLEVDIQRPVGTGETAASGGVIDLEDAESGPRRVILRPNGHRWDGELDTLPAEVSAAAEFAGDSSPAAE